MFHYFFRKCVIFLLVFFLPPVQASKKVNDLKREISLIKSTLDRIENSIAKDKLGKNQESKDFLYKFQMIIRKRINGLIRSFDALFKVLSNPSLKKSFVHKEFFLALSGSLLFFFAARFFVRSSLSRKRGRDTGGPLGRTTLLTCIIFVPSIFALLFSAFMGLILFPGSGLFASKKGLSFLMTFPFHIYFSWAVFMWVDVVFLSRPSQNILSAPHSIKAKNVSLWLKLFSACYLSSIFLLCIFQVFVLYDSVQKSAENAILDLGIFLCTLCIARALSLLAKQVPEKEHTFDVQRFFVIFKWTVILSCVLWFFKRGLCFRLLPLIFLTTIAFLSAGIVEKKVRCVRLSILWSMRHKSFALRPLFRSHVWFHQAVQAIIWFTLLRMWLAFFDHSYFFYTPFSLSMLSSLLTRMFSIAVIIVIANALVKGVDRILIYYIQESGKNYQGKNYFLSKRLETLMSMVKTLTRLVIWVPACSLILGKVLSLDVRAWITGISLGSFGLAFGMQQLVRDFTTGFFVILENNLMVGDEVDVDRHRGVVESISMRTLKIRTDYGMLLTIPFGSIHIIGNKNRSFSAFLVNVSVDYKEDPDRIKALLEEAFAKVRSLMSRKIYGNIEIRGLHEVTSYSLVVQAKIKTAPNAQDLVRCAFNRALKDIFDREGISVPKSPHAVDRALPSLTNTFCKERGALGETLS
jgi:small-conductance mechanosensitive channel